MIQEDYVSFEIAKLLKEKGFDEVTPISYRLLDGFSQKITCRNSLDEGMVSMVTLQMAMKWLREVHKLCVQVCPSVESNYWTEKWHSYVDNLEERYPFGRFIGTFNSYEEACEAAIKYCLENKN